MAARRRCAAAGLAVENHPPSPRPHCALLTRCPSSSTLAVTVGDPRRAARYASYVPLCVSSVAAQEFQGARAGTPQCGVGALPAPAQAPTDLPRAAQVPLTGGTVALRVNGVGARWARTRCDPRVRRGGCCRLAPRCRPSRAALPGSGGASANPPVRLLAPLCRVRWLRGMPTDAAAAMAAAAGGRELVVLPMTCPLRSVQSLNEPEHNRLPHHRREGKPADSHKQSLGGAGEPSGVAAATRASERAGRGVAWGRSGLWGTRARLLRLRPPDAAPRHTCRLPAIAGVRYQASTMPLQPQAVCGRTLARRGRTERRSGESAGSLSALENGARRARVGSGSPLSARARAHRAAIARTRMLL